MDGQESLFPCNTNLLKTILEVSATQIGSSPLHSYFHLDAIALSVPVVI